MNTDKIVKTLAEKLEAAAPSGQPPSTRGIPGGAIDWESIAEAIVEAIEAMKDEDDE